MRLSLVASAILLLPAAATAQRNAAVPDPDPELERKTFVLPDGFEVNLFAADPMLAKPIQMNFDSRGRLWVAASEVYPQIKPGQKANDKILILEDTTGKGVADKTTVFADGLLIPTAVEPDQKGGAWVADSTDLLHLSEPDPKTGMATKKRIVLSGFGTEDTHHILHTFRTGPDGNLYMSQSVYIHSHVETPHGVRRLNAGGIWQFNPRTEKLEVFARGWWNSWGTAWDRYGATFATDGAGGQGINYVVPGAYYEASRDAVRILPGLNPGSPKYCGLEIVGGRHLPPEWEGNLITNDFRGHRVCRFVVKEDGAGFVSQEQKELIKSNHPAFRPIDVKMGPDGAIYVADWYNPIIQHGEVDFRDERRDKTHGRIWRITAKGRPLVAKPKISGEKVEDLLELLKAPEQWTRNHARRELLTQDQRHVSQAIDRTYGRLGIKMDDHHRLEAMWLEQPTSIMGETLVRLLNSKDPNVRAAACRIGGSMAEQGQPGLARLSDAVKDEHPRVRLEAVRALAKSHSFVGYIAAALDKPTDRWLDYAIWQSLRESKDQWLPDVKAGKFDFGGDPKKLVFALQASGESDVAGPLVKMLNAGKTRADEIDNILLAIAKTGGPKEIGIVLERCRLAIQRAKVYPAIEQSVNSRKLPIPPGDPDLALAKAISDDTGVSRQVACRLIGAWKIESCRVHLTNMINGLLKDATAADRGAAIEGLTLLGGEKSAQFLARYCLAAAEPEDRRQALVGLAHIDAERAAEVLLVAIDLIDKKPMDLEPVFAAFAARKGGTAALTKAIGDRTINPDFAKLAVRAAKANGQADAKLVEALTKAGGLADQKRNFTPAERDQFLKDVKTAGDPARGEAVYRRAELTCLKCHAIAGAGGQVGPDLTSLGASAQPDYLLESLLDPNAKIKEGFHSVIVTTIDDRVIAGIKVRETPAELVLRDAEDKEIVISKADRPEIKPGRSLMPDGLTDGLTRAELVDLVRFLSELGKGPYLAQPGKVVRRWQAVTPTKEFYTTISRDRIAAVATDKEMQWVSAYATVAGELPLGDVPPFRLGKEGKPQAAVRFQFEVTTPGPAAFVLPDVTGVQLWLDGTPIEPKARLVLDVAAGLRTFTVLADLDARKTPLRMELDEAPNSAARVRLVGGK